MENVAEEDGIFELETPSSEILQEMTYDRQGRIQWFCWLMH
jgi:hypothetical protein